MQSYRRLHALLSFAWHGTFRRVQIFASRAILTVLTEVGPQFERVLGSGVPIRQSSGPSADFTSKPIESLNESPQWALKVHWW